MTSSVSESATNYYTPSNKKERGINNNGSAGSYIPTKPPPSRTPSTRIAHTARPPRQHGQTANSVPTNPRSQRPGLEHRRTTARTRYIDMLLGLDSVSPLHNLLCSAFVWLLLAGYIVFPATFTKLQRTDSKPGDNGFSAAALKTVRNIPLLYVAAFACGIGVVGCLWLWWQHRKNYVWVIHRIFLPALLNSIAGLISTIVNVYSAQDGQYSITARVTIVVTAACSVVAAALFLVYNTIMLGIVRRRHEREIAAVEKGQARRDASHEEAV
ncbi:hypothetical protein GGP41_002733 [Bipolaris sorokiniana]|uniref:Uncharacterized protein n=1 Tax=Cochliobolus sativus TaxID=45130 RepID=A0A8H5ZJW8_COCSA|nr:hypothetical protein GGP41_002733 [Bipolaris sorokiniana]